jgi:alpha-galactosidase
MKIVLIGAGSMSFGRGQIADLLQAEALAGRGIRLTLVDTDAQALAMMRQLAERIKAHTGTDIALDATADRRQALPGADFVITAVAQQRYPLWEQDFRVPLAYGFRHCLGENGGPGAVFHTLRSLALMLPICADIERLCPQALLLNFTNPEARVLHAILHLTKVNAIGICHGVASAMQLVSQYLEKPLEALHIVSAGINHFYTLLSVTEKATGTEWLPELVQMAATDRAPRTPVLFRQLAQAFEVFTFPSDDHIGEYLAYGVEYSGTKWHYGQECRPVTLHAPQPSPTLADYAAGACPLDGRILAPSGELTVPIIGDIVHDRGAYREAVNVLNTAGFIPNLPTRAAIEVPAMVDAAGVHPLHVGPIPEPFAALMRTQIAIQEVLTAAYHTRSKKLLLQALLLDPTVTSIDGARALLDEMLGLQREFLPEFR